MQRRDNHRPFPARAVATAVIAGVAILLAATPWISGWIAALDQLAPAWPLAPVLAIGALVLARGRGPAAIGAIGALALCIPTILVQPVPNSAPQAGLRLRVVTHNVWTRNVDPVGTAAVLAGSGADILLLQETAGQFASALPMLARSFPYTSRCQRRRCAVTILSRYPIEQVGHRSPDRLWRRIDPGVMLEVHVRLPGDAGTIAVVTVHLARGQPPGADLNQRTALAQALRRADGESLILAGDFNLVPWSARMRALEESLDPLVRGTATLSWPARVGERSSSLPLVSIDHVFAGTGWAVAGVYRLSRTGSDHYPIAVDLIWQGRGAMVTTGR